MPKVSVVIPSHNSAHFVGDAVQSVLDQTFTDLELIVVDDGSTDDTREVIARFDDPRLRYLYQENRERSAARNAGITVARGQYIAFLDADDVWLLEKLEEQVALLDAKPWVGLVYAGVYVMEDGKAFFEQKCKFRGKVLRPLLVEDNIVTGSASSAIVRRECFDLVGTFDERSSVCEDWDMWLRIASKFEFDYVPQPLAKVRVHGRNTQKQVEKMKAGTLAFFKRVLHEPAYQVEVVPLRKRVESLAFFMIGRAHYAARQMGPARRCFLRSIVYYPLQGRAWTYLVRSFLGARSTEFARGIRNRFIHLLRYRSVR